MPELTPSCKTSRQCSPKPAAATQLLLPPLSLRRLLDNKLTTTTNRIVTTTTLNKIDRKSACDPLHPKLTTSRNIASRRSRRSLKKNQKVPTFHISGLFDFSGLFNVSGLFDVSGLFNVSGLFDVLFFLARFDFVPDFSTFQLPVCLGTLFFCLFFFFLAFALARFDFKVLFDGSHVLHISTFRDVSTFRLFRCSLHLSTVRKCSTFRIFWHGLTFRLAF